jgi:hypothetical protein
MKASEITITFSESPAWVRWICRFVDEDCWVAVDKFLRSLGAPDLGYYKTDFTTVFEDGFKYSGTIDLDQNFVGLKDHIIRYLKTAAGQKPGHLTDEQWQMILNRIRPREDRKQEATMILLNYFDTDIRVENATTPL